MASIGLLHHYNIRTTKLDETVSFYESVLGLEVGPRPSTIALPGAWLYSEGVPVVHLIDISGTDEKPQHGGGAVDHVSFSAEGFDEMVSSVKAKGIEHTARGITASGIKQLFVTDPNGVQIELNFHEPG